MQIPFVGFQPIRTSEHMAATGIFFLVIAVGFFRYLQSMMTKADVKYLTIVFAIVAGSLVYGVVVYLTYKGLIAPWSGRYVNT